MFSLSSSPFLLSSSPHSFSPLFLSLIRSFLAGGLTAWQPLTENSNWLYDGFLPFVNSLEQVSTVRSSSCNPRQTFHVRRARPSPFSRRRRPSIDGGRRYFFCAFKLLLLFLLLSPSPPPPSLPLLLFFLYLCEFPKGKTVVTALSRKMRNGQIVGSIFFLYSNGVFVETKIDSKVTFFYSLIYFVRLFL